VGNLGGALSSQNQNEDIRSGMRRVGEIIICDCTGREGEQAASVDLGADIKVELIRLLDSIGIAQAQAGYPAKSRADSEAVTRLRRLGLRIKIEVIAQVFDPHWRDELDAAVACGPDIIDVQLPCSDDRLRLLHHMTRDEMLARSVEAIRYVRDRVPIIRFAPTDTTRADLNYVRALYHAALEAGADRLSLADTSGSMFPPAMRWLVNEITGEFDVPVQVHCHNDFGLALANTLAAAEGGATILDATVNGLGERSGNTCLDELAVALETFYKVRTGVELKSLYRLAHQVSRWTGVPLPVHKPLVGDNAFAHKLEGHVRGVLISPTLYEPLPPETIGNVRRVPIGRYSGAAAVRYRLQQLGVDVSGGQVQAVLNDLAKRWEGRTTSLSDDEFVAIAEATLRGGADE